MNLKKIFKRVIVIDFLLILLLFISVFFQSEIVIAFNEGMYAQNTFNDMLDIISIFFILFYLVNLYLLLNFKKIGKQMYLFLFIFGSIFSLLLGINAYDPIFYVLDGLNWTMSGVILTFLYFTPIKKEFEK